MRVLVVGAGAVGGYVGGRLVQAGREVDLLVRPARAEQLRERGLRIVVGDQVEVIDIGIVTAEELAAPYDLVLIGVKSDALPAAVADVAPAVGPDTVVVPFLNGMAHIDLLTERFGDAVLGGVLKVVTQLDPNGDIRQFVPGGQIEVGELSGGDCARVQAVAQALTIPGFAVTVPADMLNAMWAKWVMIASIGAITAVARGTIGDVVAVPGGSAFAAETLAEAESIATAAGHPVTAEQHAAVLATVTMAGAPTTSSLSRELVSGRPTEVENVLGDLIDRARGFGVAVPRLEAAALALRVHNARVEADARG